jgi:hypothetical protein
MEEIQFDWNIANIDHIGRHGVTPNDVSQVFAIRSLTSERDDQDGIDSLTEIAGIQRHDKHTMAHRRIARQRSPNLAAPRGSTKAGQSLPTAMRHSTRFPGRTPRPQPLGAGH